MPPIVLFTALLGLCFLYGLNLNLRGTLTQALGGVIGLVIFAAMVWAFIFLGWRLGLIAVAATAISIPMMQSVTRPLVGGRRARPTPSRHDDRSVGRTERPSDPPTPASPSDDP